MGSSAARGLKIYTILGIGKIQCLVNSSTLGIPCTIGMWQKHKSCTSKIVCQNFPFGPHNLLSQLKLVWQFWGHAHIFKWCSHTNMIKPLQRHCFLGAWMYQKAVNFILSDSVAMNYQPNLPRLNPLFIENLFHASNSLFPAHDDFIHGKLSNFNWKFQFVLSHFIYQGFLVVVCHSILKAKPSSI